MTTFYKILVKQEDKETGEIIYYYYSKIINYRPVDRVECYYKTKEEAKDVIKNIGTQASFILTFYIQELKVEEFNDD